MYFGSVPFNIKVMDPPPTLSCPTCEFIGDELPSLQRHFRSHSEAQVQFLEFAAVYSHVSVGVGDVRECNENPACGSSGPTSQVEFTEAGDRERRRKVGARAKGGRGEVRPREADQARQVASQQPSMEVERIVAPM